MLEMIDTALGILQKKIGITKGVLKTMPIYATV